MKYLLSLLSLCLFVCCTKEEPEPKLPKPNEADTMRALINGEEWSPACQSAIPGLGCTKVNCQYYDDTGGFQIGAGGEGYAIAFSKTGGQGGVQVGINELPYRRVVVTCAPEYCMTLTCRQYELDTSTINFLEILEINSDFRIIEGIFEFRAVNQECSDTLLVTEGYFRTNY